MTTLAWNVMVVVVVVIAGLAASSVALIASGLDCLIEIGACVVVIWELSAFGEARKRQALTLIAMAFTLLGGYMLVESVVSEVTQHHPVTSWGGALWTRLTELVMVGPTSATGRTGRVLDQCPVGTFKLRAGSFPMIQHFPGPGFWHAILRALFENIGR